MAVIEAKALTGTEQLWRGLRAAHCGHQSVSTNTQLQSGPRGQTEAKDGGEIASWLLFSILFATLASKPGSNGEDNGCSELSKTT